MARKAEIGIEYFPMNSDIIHNPKVKLVVAEFGSKTTWTVLLPLYCKIYREKGYWIDWHDDDSKLLFAQDECKIETTVMNEFVQGCVRRSLFDKGVFDLFGVLTSDRIQENYLVAKSRLQEVGFIEEFAVKNKKGDYVYKSFDNVNIISLNADIITKKVHIGTQSKKENKIIEREGDRGSPPIHSADDIEKFNLFSNWIKKNACNVGKMKEPFTIEQFLKLKNDFTNKAVQDLILKMHNYKPLLQKNNSAYLTLLNWSKKDFNGKEEAVQQTGSNINEALKSTLKK